MTHTPKDTPKDRIEAGRRGGQGPDAKSRCRYYSLSKDRFNKRVFMPRCNLCGKPLDMMTDNGKVVYVHPCEDCKLKVHAMRVLSSPPVEPDPIKLDEGEVVVLIKTTEGDVYLKV